MKYSKKEIRKSMLLYAVTDRMWLKEGEKLTDVCKNVLEHGATFLQIREKDLDEGTFEQEAEELKGSMHRAEDVAAMTEDLVYTIRGALNALPGRLAVDTAAAATPAEASEVIRKEVGKVMRELAAYHYDPKKYEERVRERRDWSERDSDDE